MLMNNAEVCPRIFGARPTIEADSLPRFLVWLAWRGSQSTRRMK